MFHYHFKQLNQLITDTISKHVTAEAFTWLKGKSAPAKPAELYAAFAAIPRITGKKLIPSDNAVQEQVSTIRTGFIITNWSIDRLARVWLVMQLDATDKDKYFQIISNLFVAADVNEQVALYSSLPVLAYPEIWASRCSEGIRSNIADVLTAIMCNNPYPSENLDDAAWNQLVLKAFFTEKPVEQIVGLDIRRNEKLGSTLLDYAHERWAAHRHVNPQLWRLVGPYINDSSINDIKKVFASDNEIEREAGALACLDSNYAPAKQLVPANLAKSITAGELTWTILAEKSKDYVLQ